MPGPLLIVAAAALWALDGVVRRSLYHLPPVSIVFYEHLIGALILLPITVSILKKEVFTPKLILTSLIVALFGGLLGTLFITTALMKVGFISFSVVFLIQKVQPLFAIVSANLLLKEKISKNYLKWALLAIIAVFFVTFKNGQVNLATGSQTAIAALYALGAAACWGLGTTLSKLLLNQVKSSTSATILRFYFSTILAYIAVFVLNSQSSLDTLVAKDFLSLLYIALSTGLLAMILYYKGLQTTEAKVATILELTLPIMAIVIDMLVYRNFLASSQYLAALVLMYAMYRVSGLGKAVAKPV
jgi:drug/metabolite transporter (DMT)-like permease